MLTHKVFCNIGMLAECLFTLKFQLNTYQLILTTDEVRSYVVFNYAHINYTSSSDAGSVNGKGGLQSALVFNYCKRVQILFFNVHL